MYKAQVTHKKDFTFLVKSGNHEVTIDAKGEEGISPPDALLASFGSCLGVYIRKYAVGAKLPLENFNISVEADFTKESPVRFKVINVVVDFKNFGLDGRRKNALLEFIKNCPVHNTLKGNPHLELKIS
ncbi:MAG: OsmC family protein [Candidatus Omnitrophota bacterium]